MSKSKQLFDEEREKARHSDDAITVLTNFFNALAENNGSLKPPKT